MQYQATGKLLFSTCDSCVHCAVTQIPKDCQIYTAVIFVSKHSLYTYFLIGRFFLSYFLNFFLRSLQFQQIILGQFLLLVDITAWSHFVSNLTMKAGECFQPESYIATPCRVECWQKCAAISLWARPRSRLTGKVSPNSQ